MIKKMRRKFLFTATLAIMIVTMIIVGTINGFNYYRLQQEVYEILNYISDSEGTIDYSDNTYFSRESLYELRYFTVTITNDAAQVMGSQNITTVDRDKALTLAYRCFHEHANRGILDDNERTYGYVINNLKDGKRIIILDCTTRFAILGRTLRMSLVIGIICIILFCLLMFLLSPLAIKPYIDNIENQKMFITNAGHELKTPLAVISANTEVMEMLNGESEWTRSNMTQVKKMSGLINELIMLSRMSETVDIILSDIDYTAVLKECINTFMPIVASTDKQLVTQIEDDVHVNAEIKNLQALIDILLDNAIKYCDDGGTIGVSLNKRGRQSVLTVYNDYEEGANIDYHRFFDRFYRQDTSHNSKKQGFGIGLSMAASVVELFKGKIRVDYKNGVITFTVTI